MRVVVQTPLKHEEIKGLLEHASRENIRFKFIEKVGVKLIFEVFGTEEKNSCNIAKELIKETDWGKVLYFSVIAE